MTKPHAPTGALDHVQAAAETMPAEADRLASAATTLDRFDALDSLSGALMLLDDTRESVARATWRVIDELLRAEVDPRALYDRPFSSTMIRKRCDLLGVPRSRTPGRRPREAAA